MRRAILGLTILTFLATCLLAFGKLSATPKYDRVQPDMTLEEVTSLLGSSGILSGSSSEVEGGWSCDEGLVLVHFRSVEYPDANQNQLRVAEKIIKPHTPLERLAWWMGRKDDV